MDFAPDRKTEERSFGCISRRPDTARQKKRRADSAQDGVGHRDRA